MIETIIEYIAVLLPLAVIQIGLMIFCLVKINKEGVGNLSKLAWILIVIFINLFGSILYLVVGRKKDNYDSGE